MPKQDSSALAIALALLLPLAQREAARLAVREVGAALENDSIDRAAFDALPAADQSALSIGFVGPREYVEAAHSRYCVARDEISAFVQGLDAVGSAGNAAIYVAQARAALRLADPEALAMIDLESIRERLSSVARA